MSRWTRKNPILTQDDADQRYIQTDQFAPDRVLTSAVSVDMTSDYNTYVHTGGSGQNYTLPLASSVAGMAVTLANRGSSTTVLIRSGSDQIFVKEGTLVTNLAVSPGFVRRVISDGTYWILSPNAVFFDAETRICNLNDRSKVAVLDASAISTATTRTYTWPDASGQLQVSNVTVSATSITLPAVSGPAIFTGTSSGTFTLPSVSGNRGQRLTIRNRGTATLAVSRAGTDQIYNATSAVTTVAVYPTNTVDLVCDGTYWVVTSTVGVKDGEFRILNSADRSKVAVLSAGGQTTASTRTHTLPDYDSTIAGWVSVPASASAAGTAGQIARDANYVYICTATNTWARAAISGW